MGGTAKSSGAAKISYAEKVRGVEKEEAEAAKAAEAAGEKANGKDENHQKKTLPKDHVKVVPPTAVDKEKVLTVESGMVKEQDEGGKGDGAEAEAKGGAEGAEANEVAEIYIGNLSWDVNETDLISLFQPLGAIVDKEHSVSVVRDRISGRFVRPHTHFSPRTLPFCSLEPHPQRQVQRLRVRFIPHSGDGESRHQGLRRTGPHGPPVEVQQSFRQRQVQ